MKNNNKKGFTLIELLAVLVVLAILALIAIPIVIKVINNAREDSYKRSIEGYARAVEMGLARWAMANPGVDFPGYISKIVDEEENTLIDYKGDTVSCDDEIKYDKDTNQVQLTNCYVLKSNGESKSETYDYDGVEVKPSTSATTVYEEYNVGDTFTFGGAGYHVIAESGTNQEYVVALKDEPLTTDEVNTYGVGHINRYVSSNQGTAVNYNGYGGILYYTSSTCGSNPNWDISGCISSYNTSEIKYVVDAWAKTLPSELYEVNSYKARLITLEDLTNNLGYEYYEINTSRGYESTSNTPIWLNNFNNGYWTMTAVGDSNRIVYIAGSNLSESEVHNVYATVRPVINVKKSAITN